MNHFFSSEPRDEAYEVLIDLAASKCKTFSLVWRYFPKPHRVNTEITEALESFFVRESLSAEWPGTELGGAKATVSYYELSSGAASVLKKAGGLYQWLQPGLPEDLAFYMPNGQNWLASVAHERTAWISDSTLETEELVRMFPQLGMNPENRLRR